MKKPIRPIDPELAEFEAALLRSIGQARSGEVGARHTPEMPPSDARGVQAVPMIGRRGRVYEVLNRKLALPVRRPRATPRARLSKDRAMTSITLRIPVDVVESMKAIAPQRGLAGYQTLLKLYLSEGLRRDESRLSSGVQARLMEALKKHGVSQAVLDKAAREVEPA